MRGSSTFGPIKKFYSNRSKDKTVQNDKREGREVQLKMKTITIIYLKTLDFLKAIEKLFMIIIYIINFTYNIL